MTQLTRCFLTALVLLAGCNLAFADTGVIIPSDRQAPDPAELSIESFKITVTIDSGHALVHLNEVFRNKTDRVLEGTYQLALPAGAQVSDFAVWDDVTRIPGVILERKRAGALYAQIRNEAIDPGLLESGEVTESAAPGQASRSTQFTVKIVPIPAWGYKRVEAEYRQSLPLNQLASQFTLPLKSSAEAAPLSALFSVTVALRSPQKIASFENPVGSFPLSIDSRTAHLVKASYSAASVALDRDLTLQYSLEKNQQPVVQTYRDAQTSEPGFFEASTLLSEPRKPAPKKAAPRTVLVLFDASLSMQWDKLERSFQTLEAILRSLAPADLFNVLVFNSSVTAAHSTPQPATPEAVSRALEFVRASRLAGGTNLQKAFDSAFAQTRSNTYLALISDGGASEGVLAPARLSEWLDTRWNSLAKDLRPHIYTLAVGDDANLSLLRQFASHDGVFEAVGSSESLDFKLSGFVRKLGLVPVDSLALAVSPSVGPRLIYRIEDDNFPGARASWVGQYAKPGNAKVSVAARYQGKLDRQSVRVKFPEDETDHPYLPAAWAEARVAALLEKIDRDGEDKASIEEIIQLSRLYRFVTPYTSFLAAPRALLRPRLIRPGDPLLRVRTDSSIHSVIALFPFGLIKPLRYLKNEDIWETRFLAPEDLVDGVHTVRLILRDREGRVFREQKTFVISSHAPTVRVQLSSPRTHPGASLALRVQASATTRTIAVRLYGAEPLFLHWNDAQKSNTGILNIPSALPAGRYSLHVTAEDIAHNVSHQEVPLEVLP